MFNWFDIFQSKRCDRDKNFFVVKFFLILFIFFKISIRNKINETTDSNKFVLQKKYIVKKDFLSVFFHFICFQIRKYSNRKIVLLLLLFSIQFYKIWNVICCWWVLLMTLSEMIIVFKREISEKFRYLNKIIKIIKNFIRIFS